MRMIYALISDSAGLAYIGLTKNLKTRVASHLRLSQTSSSRVIANEDFRVEKLSEYVDDDTARALESYFISAVAERGYTITNVATPGCLGYDGHLFWTKEKVYEEAKKYSSYTLFSKDHKAAVTRAYVDGYLKELKSSVGLSSSQSEKWNKESVMKLASQYKTLNEFYRDNLGAYGHAYNNGYIKELPLFMAKRSRWTKTEIMSAASKCITISEFRKNFPGPYQRMHLDGFYEEVCKEKGWKQRRPRK